jgi:hypothetical protein
MRTYESICLGVPEILLPRPATDLTKWAVIACDQYTSEPDYWRKAADLVGAAPSTLNLIYPEVFLGEKDPEARITRIQATMHRYLNQGLFDAAPGFVYVERTVAGHTRKGLVITLDLEHYDFRKGAESMIRATEGTILERLPPRVKIREGALLELPHIMVLIDDPGDMVLGPLAANRAKLPKLYDFELMLGSGHLAGFRVGDEAREKAVVSGLRTLADPVHFVEKYGLKPGTPVLLYAMGDGNHSLATAKTIWETTKAHAADRTKILASPLRYALVEIVNLHDDALVFEPIHRVLFDLAPGAGLLARMDEFYPGRCRHQPVAGLEEMKAVVDTQSGALHKVGLVSAAGCVVAEIEKPEANLPVGTLQTWLDAFMKAGGAREIDYVHGTESLAHLGTKPGNVGLYLPAMRKKELFRTVILDGALPRKTFSMGESHEKRFYMEARKLI